MKRIVLSLMAIMYVATLTLAKISLSHLTTEGRDCPLGIDVSEPRFGWQIVSDRRGVMQRSYRIIVASSREKIDSGAGDVWDSGTVMSDSSQWVAYKGRPLRPNAEYFWKVEVRTNRGTTGWSPTARWSTGLMNPEGRNIEWIGLDSLLPGDSDSRHSRIASRYLRREFTADANVKRATIHICGLGLYTLSINGRHVGGGDVLTPVATDYTKSVIYNTYDVTSLISSRNAIGVTLAGGHYFAQTQNYQTNVRTTYGYPKLMAQLIIEYSDGRTDTVTTDTSWRLTADGPVRYANEYDGELYDARRRMTGWTEWGYDDSRWMPAQRVAAPGGRLCGNVTPAMEVYEKNRPVALRRYGRRYIADFGTNGAGRIRLKTCGREGDTIVIRHAERLGSGDSTLYRDNLRSAEATARYVSDGQPREWAPEFTYYGFRYAEITCTGPLTEDDIVRELIADRMDDADTQFHAEARDGNDMLNAIVDCARRGIRSNYKGMPVDCPQRDERMPWLGDRTTGCFGESYMMDNRSLYAKWVADICQSQRDDGCISDVAPAYWRLYNGNVTWPAALPFACDMLYRQYGDLRPMRESYEPIKRFLAFVNRKHRRGSLIGYDRYGDWCVPPESPKLVHSKDPARQTDGRLIASTYYQYLCRMMQGYAGLLGRSQDEEHFRREAEAMAAAVNDTFFVGGRYANGTVTANLLPLAMNIVPQEHAAAVADSIVSTICVRHNGHISSGVIGIQWLMRWLSDAGHGDMAYRMASADTYPGWGYMVRQGATTIWELWNGDTANPSMNSGNHVMLLGDLLPWCYERLGGIRPDIARPGFRHTILRPDFSVSELNGVTAAHPSPYGVIRSSWKRDGEKIVWDVDIPANTTAEVHLPDGRVKRIGSGRYRFSCRQ
ncbi:MAG: family 78 glycoside hydrolase catalytic domain [Prevotella sp.]|nr:family 78 glycoside hydrolase catalytic domain [Prevotella sp.]